MSESYSGCEPHRRCSPHSSPSPFLAALCLAPAPLQAQAPPQYVLGGNQPPDNNPQPDYATDHYTAVVVSLLDGKPVPRVLVTSGDRRFAALTDYQGRISFDYRRIVQSTTDPRKAIPGLFGFGLYGGPQTMPIQFQIRKPGYVSNMVVLYLPAVPPDTPQPPLQLKIVPAGIIIGHVDPDNDAAPVPLQVQLYRKSIQNGIATWNTAAGAAVKPSGEFRFPDLQPGDYKLGTAAWTSPAPQRPPLDSVPGLKPSFYPDAATLDSAGILHVGPAETVTARLVPHAATFYHVTIPIAGADEAAGASVMLLSDSTGLNISFNSQDHALEGYLPTGSYTADVITFTRNPPSSAHPARRTRACPARAQPAPRTPPLPSPTSRSAALRSTVRPSPHHPPPISPSTSTANSPTRTPPGLTTSESSLRSRPGAGQVQRMPAVSVFLQPLASNRGSSANLAPVLPGDPDDNLKLQNVTEGVYHVNVQSMQGGYVASATCGTTDLLRDPLTVGASGSAFPIVVTLRDDAASVTGSILPELYRRHPGPHRRRPHQPSHRDGHPARPAGDQPAPQRRHDQPVHTSGHLPHRHGPSRPLPLRRLQPPDLPGSRVPQPRHPPRTHEQRHARHSLRRREDRHPGSPAAHLIPIRRGQLTMRPRTLPLALLLCILPVSAQRAESAATYPIAGTVVAETSGQPLQRATVEIINSATGKQAQTTTSDEFGHFVFPAVPAGNFILQGAAAGYLQTNYDDHDGFTTGIILPTSVDTQSLVLKLHPQGVLTGTILDENAEPIRQASVRLFHQTDSFGDDRIVSAGTTNTDDLGHFEFSRLAPGAYLLAVTATPWYAVHPFPQQPGQRQLPFGFADSIDPALDVAYPTTFYPGTTDSSQATPILLRGGPVEINLRLSPVPALSITFPSTPQKNGQFQPAPQLRTSLFGQLEFVPQQETRQTGSQLVIAGLAPGDYILVNSNQPNNLAEGGTTLHLTDRNADATLPATPGLVHVHVLLKADDGTAIPPNMLVALFRQNTTDVALRVNSAKAEAKLDVPPGDYYFSLCTGQRHCFIRQIFNGDQPLPGNNIHLASGADPTFTIHFNLGAHTVKGVAQRDGKPIPGAFLLIFPTSEAHEIRTFFRNQSDLDGSFDFKGLAPGAYTVLSIDNGWNLEWSRDVVLSRYLPAAVTVQIPDNAPETVTIPTPVPVQPKVVLRPSGAHREAQHASRSDRRPRRAPVRQDRT